MPSQVENTSCDAAHGNVAPGLLCSGGLAVSWGGTDGTGGDLLQRAQSFVDGLGVGEGVEQVQVDDREVCPLLQAVGVFAANAFAEIEVGARRERIELVSFAHIVPSRLQWSVWLR